MSTLENKLYAITEEFKSTNGKKDKEALLKRYENDSNFKQYLIYILEPSFTYGLQDKKIKKFADKIGVLPDNSEEKIEDLFRMFQYLAVNNTGTDANAELVARFIKSFSDEGVQRFILESITKKMKIGVTAKTVNKAYGKDFINHIEIMLADKYEDKSHKIENEEIVITEKFDGQRCVFIKEDDVIVAKSREAIVIEGLVDIEKEIAQLPDGVYDGELLTHNHEELKDREVLQETLKITRKDGDKTGLYFYLFDSISLEEFDKGKSKLGYMERRAKIEELLSNYPSFKEVSMIPMLYHGKDHSVIGDMIAVMDAKGREGLMVNVANAPYECKRTHQILKVKTMKTADLKIIGFESGKALGKFENTLGKIIVDYKGYPLGVSGITDALREQIWNDQENYIGRIIEVSYFRESKNEKGGLSVSFPQFKGFRDDKTEPSYY